MKYITNCKRCGQEKRDVCVGCGRCGSCHAAKESFIEMMSAAANHTMMETVIDQSVKEVIAQASKTAWMVSKFGLVKGNDAGKVSTTVVGAITELIDLMVRHVLFLKEGRVIFDDPEKDVPFARMALETIDLPEDEIAAVIALNEKNEPEASGGEDVHVDESIIAFVNSMKEV